MLEGALIGAVIGGVIGAIVWVVRKAAGGKPEHDCEE